MYRRDKSSSAYSIDLRLAPKHNQLDDLGRDMNEDTHTVETDRKRSRPINSYASKTQKKLGKHTKQQVIHHLLFQPSFLLSSVLIDLASESTRWVGT